MTDPLAHLPTLARASVQTWECDQMGHFNVQFYITRACESARALIKLYGLAEPDAIIFRASHTRFLAEQLPGAPYYCKGGVIMPAAASAELTLYIEMRESASHRPAAGFLLDITLPTPIKPEALRDIACTVPPHGQPKGLSDAPPRPRPLIADIASRRMIETHMTEINAARCMGRDTLSPEGFMGIVSESVPNLLAQSGRVGHGGEHIGGAALEYRFVYHSFPRRGDFIRLHSGLAALSEKTYIWVHWAMDAASGEAVATIAAVAIALDLKARKAVPIPEATRANLTPYIDESLSV